MKFLLIPIVIAFVVFVATAITFIVPRTLNLANRSDNTGNTQIKSVSNLKLGGVLKTFDSGQVFDIKANISGQEKVVLDQNIQNLYFGFDNKTLYSITPNAVYYSKDKAENWEIAFSDKNYFIDSFQFNPSNNDEIYIGTSLDSKSRLIKYNIINKNYEELYLEVTPNIVIRHIFVNRESPNNIKLILSNGIVLTTENSGKDWKYERTYPDAVQSVYIDSKDSNIVYFLGEQGLYKSVDGEQNFTLLSPGYNPENNRRYKFDIYSYAINPNNSNEIYVGGMSQIVRSNDGGNTWEEVKILTPNSNIIIRSIQINPSNSDTIYYSGGFAFYKSNNRGVNWAPSELPLDLYVNKILIDSENNDIIYLGTSVPTRKR